jgi:hypothetical protein
LQEKELRLALVCFGGVSLAIYMHGVTKEILKLVRASRAYHDLPKGATRDNASFADHVQASDTEYDSEHAYFELLQELGRHIDLRGGGRCHCRRLGRRHQRPDPRPCAGA